MKKLVVALLFASICLFINANLAHSQTDIFLKVEGIDGEAIAQEYTNWIEVLTWTWQINSDSSNLEPIIVTKRIDKASPLLAYRVFTGSRINEAILAQTDQNLEYLRITLNDVQIINVSPGGDIEDLRAIESVALMFSKICYKYTEYDRNGQKRGDVERCFESRPTER